MINLDNGAWVFLFYLIPAIISFLLHKEAKVRLRVIAIMSVIIFIAGYFTYVRFYYTAIFFMCGALAVEIYNKFVKQNKTEEVKKDE